jgi:tetratricopeptide (TPR) repeat protein
LAASSRRALAALLEQGEPRARSSLRARILNNLGVSLALSGETASAKQYLDEALAMRRKLQGEDGPDYAITLRNVGLIAQLEGRLDDAEKLIEQGRDLLAGKQGVRSAEYARTAHLLGALLAVRQDDDGARAALGIALEVRRASLGADHPDTAVTLSAIADVLGRETEACEAMRIALPIFEEHMGRDHPWTIQLSPQLRPCPADSNSS